MENCGKLLLRSAIGGLMLFHGIYKLTHGFDVIGDMLEKNHLPRGLMWCVPVGEVVAPILLIIGWKALPAAALIAFTMIMSIYLVFREHLFKLNDFGSLDYEINLLYLFGSLAICKNQSFIWRLDFFFSLQQAFLLRVKPSCNTRSLKFAFHYWRHLQKIKRPKPNG